MARAQSVSGSRQLPIMSDRSASSLEIIGCKQIDLKNEKTLLEAERAKWQFVVPANHAAETIIVCPAGTVEAGGAKGRVAGINTAKAEADGDPYASGWKRFGTTAGRVGLSVFTSDNWLSKTVSFPIQKGIEAMAVMFILVGQLVHMLVAQAFVAAVSLSQFITNRVVQAFWPVALGLANLGFMLALVIIALLTVLRLEVGGGARRLLPKLFIGALLVNFSLVIGGLILDVTRVLIALIPPMFNTGSLRDLPFTVVKVFDNAAGTPNLNIVFTKFTPWGETIGLVTSAVVWWVTDLAVGVLAFGLLMRYIFLIVLLIISPFAYLFVAFPGLTGLSKRWWTAFLKYAFYGPVAIFMVVLGVRVVGENIFLRTINTGKDSLDTALVGMLDAVVLSLFFFAAAVAGKYAGIIGSAAAVSIAMRTGKGVGRVGRGMGRAGAKGAYVGSGARRLKRAGGTFADEATKPFRQRWGLGKYSKYDKDGKLKEGKTSVGSRAGQKAARGAGRLSGGVLGIGDKGAADSVQGMRGANAARAKLGTAYNPKADLKNMSVDNLSRGEAAQFASKDLINSLKTKGGDDQRAAFAGALATADSLGEEQFKAVADSGDATWIRSVVNNVSIMSAAKGSQKSALLQAAAGDASLMRDVVRALNRARQAQDRGK